MSPGEDVLLGPLDGSLVPRALHVRGERGHGSSAGCSCGRARGRRSGQQLACALDQADASLVVALDLVRAVDERVHHDRHLVAEVVEHDERVGNHQRHVGSADVVRVGLGQPLDRARQVVAEQPDGAAGERRQPVDRRDAVPGQIRRDRSVRIRPFERPAPGLLDHLEAAVLVADLRTRAEAEEGVAPEALALLRRLQQESRPAAAQLQERRHRSLACRR